MFWLQSRNVCRFDLWCINHVFTRLTLALSNCLHHSLNYCYDKLPFKIIEKVQLLENVFRGEITLSCSLLPIVLAMPPRLWHSLVIFSIIPTTAKDTQWVFNTDTAPCSEMLLTSEQVCAKERGITWRVGPAEVQTKRRPTNNTCIRNKPL